MRCETEEDTVDVTTDATGMLTGDEPLSRRTVLHLSATGAAVAFAGGASGLGMTRARSGQRARTQQVARRFLDAIATTDSSAIWAMLAPGAPIDFPFLRLRITDQATFDVTVGPVLADLSGLTFSEPDFVDLLDENAAILRYTGHAIVGSTGKPYDQTYISEIHVHRTKVTSYSEYFDTAVINEAFTP
jgi:uncharacterized protein